jgi:uncharacterized damage-inducible protein DinB
MVTSEIAAYISQLKSLLDRLCGIAEGLDEAQLNRRPPIDGSNSIYVIMAHTLGNARAWVLGIACGQPVERDRPAEFRASGRDAVALVAKLRRLSYEIETALAALPPSDLEQRLVPPASLWGEGEPHEISRREAVVHVIEHAALHLGHLQMTRDWALQAPR